MKIYFIGAGPGADDLITIRANRLIKECPICIYAGSLVSEGIVSQASGVVMDSAGMNIDQIEKQFLLAKSNNHDVARVHSGDPSIYGAITEQILLLKKHNIEYEIVPGVPAFAAAAALIGQELTAPNIAQSIILTRTSMKSSSMPADEDLENLARAKTTLIIHLSIRNIRELERKLIPHYGADCPCIVVYRATWEDELVIKGTLKTIRNKVREAKITKTALIMVGSIFGDIHKDTSDVNKKKLQSALYDKDTKHIFRY